MTNTPKNEKFYYDSLLVFASHGVCLFQKSSDENQRLLKNELLPCTVSLKKGFAYFLQTNEYYYRRIFVINIIIFYFIYQIVIWQTTWKRMKRMISMKSSPGPLETNGRTDFLASSGRRTCSGPGSPTGRSSVGAAARRFVE